MPVKRTKKDPRKRLRDELDRLVQDILAPFHEECIVCSGRTHAMHHYIQKNQSLYLRWDVRNLVPLCMSCHCKHHKGGDPRIHQVILMRKGHQWADSLEADRRKIFKYTLSNLQQVKEWWLNYKEQLAAR